MSENSEFQSPPSALGPIEAPKITPAMPVEGESRSTVSVENNEGGKTDMSFERDGMSADQNAIEIAPPAPGDFEAIMRQLAAHGADIGSTHVDDERAVATLLSAMELALSTLAYVAVELRSLKLKTGGE